MPGKSKKGGGLTSSPVYKKQGTTKSPFTMKRSPAKQGMPKSFNMKGSPSTTPGFSETKLGKLLKLGKKTVKTVAKRNPYVIIANMMVGKSATATQPGTGEHGGTKTKTYDPKTETYR